MRKGMAIAASIAALIPFGVAGTADAALPEDTTTINLCNDTSTKQDFAILGSLTGQIDDRLDGDTCKVEKVAAPWKATGNGLAEEAITVQLQNWEHRCGAAFVFEPCDFKTEVGRFVVIQDGKSGFGEGPAVCNLSKANPTCTVDFIPFA